MNIKKIIVILIIIFTNLTYSFADIFEIEYISLNEKIDLYIKDIENDLIRYLKNGNPMLDKMKKVPMNESLVELGYMDSFGVIDVVTYLENKWKVKIDDDEITKEKFGSITKMAILVAKKV